LPIWNKLYPDHHKNPILNKGFGRFARNHLQKIFFTIAIIFSNPHPSNFSDDAPKSVKGYVNRKKHSNAISAKYWQ